MNWLDKPQSEETIYESLGRAYEQQKADWEMLEEKIEWSWYFSVFEIYSAY